MIKTFNNTNIFIYNENGIKIYPVNIDINDSLITNLNENDILIEKDDFNELLIEFDKLGLSNENDNIID